MADTLAQIRIGPDQHGVRMSLGDFRDADVVEGFNYELARGVVEVTHIPRKSHGFVLHQIEIQLTSYEAAHPGVVDYSAAGSGAKVELPGMESERHPDRSVYLTASPSGDYPWDRWSPAIVIEVVSEGEEARRDYVEKRDEYLATGVLEYWIVDPRDRTMLALTRHGDQWREHRLGETGQWTTPLLPGFELKLAPVFAVLDRPGGD